MNQNNSTGSLKKCNRKYEDNVPPNPGGGPPGPPGPGWFPCGIPCGLCPRCIMLPWRWSRCWWPCWGPCCCGFWSRPGGPRPPLKIHHENNPSNVFCPLKNNSELRCVNCKVCARIKCKYYYNVSAKAFQVWTVLQFLHAFTSMVISTTERIIWNKISCFPTTACWITATELNSFY